MARWQRHAVDLSRIPRADNHTPRVRMMLYQVYHVAYLVYRTTVVVGPRTPLMSVHRSEVTVLISPFVPDSHPMLLKIPHVCVAFEKPQQFVYYRLQMQFLCREQRETVFQIESHLVTEHAKRSRSRAVSLFYALRHYTVEQVKILFHFSCE